MQRSKEIEGYDGEEEEISRNPWYLTRALMAYRSG